MGKNAMLISQYNGVLKMANTAPIAITIIGVALVVIASLVWRRRKEGKPEEIRKMYKNKVFFAQWITGVILALIGAYFMFDGDILGENTTGISTVLGIIAICLIATSNVNLLSLKRNKAD
jgi:LPXTG-motif cell wall-anchored protein